MIHNPYQVMLAERSLVVEEAEDGEYWNFRWYIDPFTNGLAKWEQFFVHISSEGDISVMGALIAPPDSDVGMMERDAVEFVRDRYAQFGLGSHGL